LQACNLLKKCIAEKGNGEYIFCKPDGQKFQEASRKFRSAVEQCKLNKNCHDMRNRVVFHTLRHTFASWLVQANVELCVVSRLLGHANIQMTMRYAHLSHSQGLEAVSKIRIGE
jgi:site-specific recombinase XerD